jgi:hypothetical protein
MYLVLATHAKGETKGVFYENASSLVGVYREKATGSSQVLTVDLEQVWAVLIF